MKIITLYGRKYNVVPAKTAEIEDTCVRCVFCGDVAAGRGRECPTDEMHSGKVPSCMHNKLYFTAGEVQTLQAN